MPTKRHGKVRRLLKGGLAKVVSLMPFTIQLNYETSTYTQPISLGVDTGSVNIGISATTEKEELFAGHFILRTDIVKLLASRRENRKFRRMRKVRFRRAIPNRKLSKGWIAPSVRVTVDSHIKVINLIHKIMPITKTIIEVGSFDYQKITNPQIKSVEYQNGEQAGFWNIREYILYRDNHCCQHCKGKSGDKVLNVHHIESRKTGGDAPNNLITLCETCHKLYHQGKIQLSAKRGKSLRDATLMNHLKWEIYKHIPSEYNAQITWGYLTKSRRIKAGIQKSHNADAFCIANNLNAIKTPFLYVGRFFARHTRSLQVTVPKKGGFRKKLVASHWIGKTKLQKHDVVEYNGNKYFIFGRSHQCISLKNAYGVLQTGKPYISYNKVRFVRRKHSSMILEKYNINKLKF